MGRRILEQRGRQIVFPLILAVVCGVACLFPDRWGALDERLTNVRYAYRARAPRALAGNDSLAVVRRTFGTGAVGLDSVSYAPTDTFLYSLALCTPPGLELTPQSVVDLRLRGRRASPIRLYFGRGVGSQQYLELDPGGDLPTSLQRDANQAPMAAGLAGGDPRGMWRGHEDAIYHEYSLRFGGSTIEVASGETTRSVPTRGATDLHSFCIAPIVSHGLTILDEVTVEAPAVGRSSSRRAVASYRLQPLLHPLDLETKLSGRGLAHLLSSLAVLIFAAWVTRGLFRSFAGQRRLRIGRGATAWRPYPMGLLTLPLQILVLCGVRSAFGLALLSLYGVALALIVHEWIDLQWFEPRTEGRNGASSRQPRRTVPAVFAVLGFLCLVAHAASYRTHFAPDFPVILAILPVVALPLLLIWRYRMDRRAPLLPTVVLLLQCGLYAPLHIAQPAITPITFYALVAIPWVVALCLPGDTPAAPRRSADRWFRVLAAVLVLVLVEVAMRGDHHLDYVSSPDCLASSYADPRMLEVAEMASVIESRPEYGSPTVEIAGSTFDAVKPPGQRRIVCLGSSSTFGAGAESHDGSYPNQLVSFLGSGTNADVAVINGGIGGARLSFLEFYLQHALLPLDPDLVILYFGMNGDSPDAARGLNRLSTWMESTAEKPAPAEMWAATQLRWPQPRLVRWMSRASSIRVVGWALGALNGLRYSGRLDVVSGPGSESYSAAIERAKRGTGSAWGIVEKCRTRGTPLLLVPELSRSENDSECAGDPEACRHPYYAVFQHLAGESESDEVYYGDLLSLLPASFRSERMIDEVHMDREGYGVLAWAMAELLGDVPTQPPAASR